MGLRGQLAEPPQFTPHEFDFRVGYVDSAVAAFDLAQRDTALLHSIKKLGRWYLDEQDDVMITPEEANKLAPDMPIPFTEPMKRGVFDDIVYEHELQKTLQMKIALGPQDMLASGMQLSASLLAHAADPIEFAAGAMMIPGVGALGRAMMGAGRVTMKSKRLARAGFALARRDKNTFAKLATEGVLGNVAVEPFIVAGTLEDHHDANIYNSFISVAGGSLGFAAAIRGLAEAPRLITKFGANAVEAHKRMADGQLMYGKKVTVSKMTKAVVDEAANSTPKVDTPDPVLKSKGSDRTLSLEHKHKDMTSKSLDDSGWAANAMKVKGARWYIPSASKSNEVTSGMNPGRNLGRGVAMTDNPVIANGYAAHSMNKFPGAVHEMKIENVNLITDMDYDSILPRSQHRQRVVKQLEEFGLNKSEIQQVIKANPTYTQVLDRLQDLSRRGRLKGVQGVKLVELENWFMDKIVPGDAVRYTNQNTGGVGHRPQNVLFVKQSTIDKLQKKGKAAYKKVDQFEADATHNTTLKQQQLDEMAQDYGNVQTDRYYDKEAAEELSKRDLNPTQDPLVREIDEITESNREIIGRMKDADDLSEADLKSLNDLDEMTELHQRELEIAKDGYNCQLEF